MKTILISLFLITSVSCQIDFSGRARNFSIELTESESNRHVFISTFGIWSLLTGIANGASGNSKTQLIQWFETIQNIKIHKTLTGDELDTKTTGVTLMSKNFMFLDEGLKILPDFRNTVTNDLGTIVENLDFKDSDAAAKKANAIIQGYSACVAIVLMSSNFSAPRMIFTNVIILKGFWTTPFNETDTRVEPFYDEEKNVIGKVNMMSLRARVAFSNIKEINSLILELPYGDAEKYSMLIILPYPKIKVSAISDYLKVASFPEMYAKLQRDIDTYGLDEISVKLPRFKISTNRALNKSLKDKGVVDIFEPGLANFQGLSNEDLYVSTIVQKAEIEVTETGTVASAATSADFTDRTLPPYYHANRPFLYYVIHKPTATKIFRGVYSKPSLH